MMNTWFRMGLFVGMVFVLPFFAYTAEASVPVLNNNGTSDTSDDYYEIETAEHLKWFADHVNAGNRNSNGKLMADIDVNPGYGFNFEPDSGLVAVTNATTTVYLGTSIKGVSGGASQAFDSTASKNGVFYKSSTSTDTGEAPSGLFEWTPIGKKDNGFTGTFDGNGKTVKGLYFNKNGDSHYTYGGFLGYISAGGIIRKVSIANSYFNVTHNNPVVGLICGVNSAGMVENCMSTGIVCGRGYTSILGGICGTIRDGGTSKNCFSTAIVGGDESETKNVGVVCGDATYGKVRDCYYNSDNRKDGVGLGAGTNDVIGASYVDIASGVVTYNLNGGMTQVNPLVWYQKLTGEDADPFPTFDSSRGAVYKAKFYDSNGYLTSGIGYANVSQAIPYQPAVVKDGVYEIGNAGQMIWFSALVGGNTEITGSVAQNTEARGVLVADVTLDNRFVPIGFNPNKASTEFTGTFDGQGHAVTFSITESSVTNRFGLFWTPTTNAKISNLKLAGNISSAKGWEYAGAVAGAAFATSISNVVSTVSLTNNKANSYTGGLVGLFGGRAKAIMQQCGVSAKIKGTQYVGGLIGAGWDATQYYTITNCFHQGRVESFYSGTYIGAIVGKSLTDRAKYYDKVVINHVYYSTNNVTLPAVGAWPSETIQAAAQVEDVEGVADAQFSSGEVTYRLNREKTDGTQVWYQTVGVGLPSCSGDTVYFGYINCKSTNKTYENTPVYNTIPTHSYSSDGFCSICGEYQSIELNNGIYEIANAGQLFWFADLVNIQKQTSSNAKLIADIDANSGYGFNFDPDTGLVAVTNATTSVYLGTGIKGESGGLEFFDNTASSNGVFYTSKTSAETCAAPSDLRMWTPIGSEARMYVGTFDGNGKTVSGLYFNDNKAKCVGLIGFLNNTGIIQKVTVANSYLNANNYVGGICGFNNSSKIYGCSNRGLISSDCDSASIGGVCGYNYYGTVSHCSNMGIVCGTGVNAYVGGICGDNNKTVSDCYNAGVVISTPDTHLGGICGCNYSDGIVSNCYNTGTFSCQSSSSEIGAICGNNYGAISTCYYDNEKSNVSGGIAGADVLTQAEGRSTTDMQGTALQEVWGAASWTYPAGEYPRLKGIDVTTLSQVLITDVQLSSVEGTPVLSLTFTTDAWDAATFTSRLTETSTKISVYYGASLSEAFASRLTLSTTRDNGDGTATLMGSLPPDMPSVFFRVVVE